MNQDARRALKILQAMYPDNTELSTNFAQFIKERESKFVKPHDLVDEYLLWQKAKWNQFKDIQIIDVKIECPYCGCHILPKYFLDHVALCKQINEQEIKGQLSDNSSGGG